MEKIGHKWANRVEKGWENTLYRADEIPNK